MASSDYNHIENESLNRKTRSTLDQSPESNGKGDETARVDQLLLDKSTLDTPPKDRGLIVYCIFLLFGIATLLPWNIFINKADYFQEKLNTNISANATYREDFTLITGLVGQITNVVMNFINIFIACGGDPKNRIPYTIALSASVMAFHVVLAAISTETWPLAFFITTCGSVFVMYVATGILQSCVYYVASMLPSQYTNAVILGSNLAGIFTSVMNILSDLTTKNLEKAAIIYFLSAFIALAFAFIGYFMLHRMKFFRYFADKARANRRQSNDSENVRPPYLKIIKKIWPILLSIWLNFFSTLAIFPVFQLGVVPVNKDFMKFDDKSWFQSIVTFLIFNVFVTIGNLIPNLIQKPGPRFIPIPVILRAAAAFLFFAFSNFEPDKRSLPVLINNDYVYCLGCILFPTIFGYLTSLLMMYAPKQVEPEYAGTAGMLSSLALVIGVTSGLNFTILFRMIVLAGGKHGLNGLESIVGVANATSFLNQTNSTGF